MRAINTIIAAISLQQKLDILSIIQDILQTRDFHMFNPLDSAGNNVEDLFQYWLALTVGNVNARYYRGMRQLRPPMDVLCNLENNLVEYESDILTQFPLPSVFPASFDIRQLDNTSYILTGDVSDPVYTVKEVYSNA